MFKKIATKLKNLKSFFLCSILILAVVGMWIGYPYGLTHLGSIPNTSNYGTFGDSYGALNTLFSGLAFATLIITLILQRKELQLQRKAVQDQQLEIQKSNDIADQQRVIANQQAILIQQQITDSKIQSFYQLLFKYIDEKNRKINALTTYSESGMNVINDFCNKFEQEFGYSTSHEYLSKLDDETLRNHINEVLYAVHSHTENQLSLIEYDEYLNFILNFIETHKDLEITENAILTFISYQNINEMKCMAYLAIENEELFDFIHKYALLRKLNTFEEQNEFFLNLVWRLYDEDSFTP
ncbi:hypothetical protein [Acinetobacter pittii]|uniref:hypothetical protein n=1 Tax=Acinetobacter pittii TaxID=48296 RepID=UPI0009927A7E|nr:hypothetical protein [Acinetobacter pittii]AQV15442.1 hypothetical protein BMU11_07695 [Acinetobacter pittii]